MSALAAPLVAQIPRAAPAPSAPPSKPPSSRPKQNKFEQLKADKDGLDVLPDIARYAELGDEREITDDDNQRLKWFGLFTRKQTPGHMMMRLRATCGKMNAAQWRVVADLSDEFGKGFCDLTTRQQIQMRWFTIGHVPQIWQRLLDVGLTTLQTGMDNVRGVCGCPAAGLTPNELFDGSPAAEAFTGLFLGDPAYTNLPRKFNATITGCRENCCHPETQDLGLVPALAEIKGEPTPGFNVLVGGKQGSGGLRPATPLDVFVTPGEAAAICSHITLIFSDHGPREARNRARLAFLIEDRGAAWFRDELERRAGRDLLSAGVDQRVKGHTDHVGIYRQKQPGLNYAGLLVPVGRITTKQMRGVADLAERYGNGEIRITTGQNVLLPGIPDSRLGEFEKEPLLQELSVNPSPVMRGLVSCTGNDYCHLALIETKGWAIEVARRLEKALGERAASVDPLTIRWSGCSAGCGLHQAGTIGLQACRSRQSDGQIVDAAHVFVGGGCAPGAAPAQELLSSVPCDDLASALLPIVKFMPRHG
jgi:ferredoxin-nitrite reductase